MFHCMMQRFNELTGCRVGVNTCCNRRGERIVCTPDDASRCFMFTPIDALVLGSFQSVYRRF
jgi:carbamoyltransferase